MKPTQIPRNLQSIKIDDNPILGIYKLIISKDLIRVERMSRHMYDIGQMLKTSIAGRAINDAELYRQVVEHRRTFIGLRGFDYDTLYPATLNIIPPASVIEQG